MRVLNGNHFVDSLAVCLIFTTLTISQTIYNGPVTVDYFEESFNQSIDDLPEITCSNTTSYSNYYNNIGFGITTNSTPVVYYKLSITSEMKEKYTSELYVSTCCDQEYCDSYIASIADEPSTSNWTADDFASAKEYCNNNELDYSFEALYNVSFKTLYAGLIYDIFCSTNYSLDTFIYIFQEKKGRINHFELSDDFECGNKAKSTIDLSEYLEGDYIIGVAGYGLEYGYYYLQLQCVEYSFPITDTQLDPPTDSQDISSITCDGAISGEIKQTNPVDYYLLNITESTYLPADLSTSNWDAIIYIFKEAQGGNYEIIDSDLYYGNLTLSNYADGIYWILVQGYLGWDAQYLLTMECAPAPTLSPTIEPSLSPTIRPSVSPTPSPTTPPKVSEELMIGIVFGSAGCLLFLIIAYYIYECVKYKNKPKEKDEATIVPVNKVIELAETKQSTQPTATTSLAGDEEPGRNAIPESMKDAPVKVEEKEELEPPLPLKASLAAGGKSVAGVFIRKLESEKSMTDQMESDQDVIQAVLAHAIACCEDGEGFDIFQVLAIRKYAEGSRDVRGFKPLERFGIEFELIKLSSYSAAVFIAIIIALTQTWGIFVVVYKLVYPYFTEEEKFECPMDAARWETVFSLKILSFLLSLVVTFFISTLLDGIKHNGLYEIMDRLELQHIKRVKYIALWIVQIGQAVNYFVCLMAILGSYFIIFSSNQQDEEDDEYTTAGLDMILNAVALFFMLELDDLMVSDDDYEDCGDHLKWILSNYTPNLQMNVLYEAKSKSPSPEKQRGHHQRSSTSASIVEFAAFTKDKCNDCTVPTMYYMINIFALIVSAICYGGGFIAPFLIFFCW